MENNKDKSAEKDNDSSSEAALERGKAAIKADDQIKNKDLNDPKVKAENKKDAEKWRNRRWARYLEFRTPTGRMKIGNGEVSVDNNVDRRRDGLAG